MKYIVIIGGGYGGIAALRQLVNTKDIQITLIDQHPYHFLQTEGYELVAGTIPFDDTIVNLHTLCHSYGDHVSFLHALVKDIDSNRKYLYVSGNQEIKYDYLIIAAGSVTQFFESIEGLKSCSHGVKSLTGAFRMKQFFEKELFVRLENAQHAKEHYSVVIGGAGLSGVEIAAEMQYYFNRYYQSNTLACDTLQIHLVCGSKTILKGLHPNVIEKSQQRLKALGVFLHTDARIKKVEHNKAFLANKETIPFDFMIFTGGIVATPMIQKMNFKHNSIGQILVDTYLQVPDKEGLFAIGDAAEIRDKKGNLIPDTAQVAIKSGICAANNIKLLLEGKKPMSATIKIKGLAIALGGKYAVLDMGKIRVYGTFGYYVKKIVEKFYKWPLWFRCKYGFTKTPSCEIRF